MTAFATPQTPQQKVALAWAALCQARYDGDAARIYVAAERLRRKIDLLPAGRPLSEIDPELDVRLRVGFRMSGVEK